MNVSVKTWGKQFLRWNMFLHIVGIILPELEANVCCVSVCVFSYETTESIFS